MATRKKRIQPLADRIRAEIERRGISGYRLTRDTGLNESTVLRFLRGGGNLTLDNAAVVIDYLGWTVGPGNTQKGAK